MRRASCPWTHRPSCPDLLEASDPCQNLCAELPRPPKHWECSKAEQEPPMLLLMYIPELKGFGSSGASRGDSLEMNRAARDGG